MFQVSSDTRWQARTLRGDRIGHTVIEGAYTREVLARIQGTMDMTALTIPHNDEVIFVGR